MVSTVHECIKLWKSCWIEKHILKKEIFHMSFLRLSFKNVFCIWECSPNGGEGVPYYQKRMVKLFLKNVPSDLTAKCPQNILLTGIQSDIFYFRTWKAAVSSEFKENLFSWNCLNNLEKINISTYVICWHLPSIAFVWLSTKSIKMDKQLPKPVQTYLRYFYAKN